VNRTIKQNFKREWQYHMMLLPAIIIVLVFCYYPLRGLSLAFQKYNPALGFSSPWVGLKNFEFLFNQPNFIRTIWNTLFMSFMKILGGIIVPVTFSLLLNEIRFIHLKRTFQTIVYLPNFLSWVILAGVMIDILASDGIVNLTLVSLGKEAVMFLGEPRLFPWSMIISDIWKTFGFGTVIYLAALASIDPGLYEAAIIDGAKRWRQTIHITIPMIMPIVMLMSILSLGRVLNAGFDQIYNLYSPIVYKTGDIIDTYVYRLGIEQAQFAVATAVGMFKSIISGILILISYYLADKLAGYHIF
jgi:putative aldouronate transport system permease protein